MSDSSTVPGSDLSPRPTTAGGLLRQARQAKGLHIAALAAAIKVVPRKLELLESDQFDKLPDATFTRALAHTVCRTLNVDAAPILALLPPPLSQGRLEQVAEGLKTPFDERPGRLAPSEWGGLGTPALALAGLLLLGAVAIYLLPGSWVQWIKGPSRAASAVAAPAVAASATSNAVTETVVLMPPSPAAAASSADAAPTESSPPSTAEVAAPVLAVAGVLKLQPTEACWVEVIDARGKTLISRLVQPGEGVGLDGEMPFKVKIGNANAMQAVFRGLPLNLGPFTRDNMARLELK